MTSLHTHANDVLDLRSSADDAHAATLVQTDHLEVTRLMVDADEVLPEHVAPGDMTIECLRGRVAVASLYGIQNVAEGQMMFLPAGATHALRGIDDSILLLTVAEPHHEHDLHRHALHCGEERPLDVVQEASEESFPASDPPSYTPVVGS